MPERNDDCVVDRLAGGGQFLRLPDGIDLWYKTGGSATAPSLVYLHGGPGYDSFAFERSAGKLLERSFHVIYVDQRGCGRSAFEGPDGSYGMEKTAEDFEQLRAALAVEHWGLIGHSFGAIVAAEYIRRHRDRVRGAVLVDMSPEVGRLFEHHLEVIDEVADRSFPEHAAEVHAIARASQDNAFDRMQTLYELLGRVPIQLHLHYPSAAARQAMDAVDESSGLQRCTSARVPAAFQREGYLDARAPLTALDVPVLLVSGAKSDVIGENNLARAAQIWGAERAVVADAGHFVYFDQPREFADLVESFFHRGGP